MSWDQVMFSQYIDELRIHLFKEMTIEQIIAEANDDHHQARRLVTMYVLKDRDTFHYYYSKREGLGIGYIFDQVISALFHETEKKLFKQDLISLLEIREDMITNKIVGYGIKEVEKDLNSFFTYWRKRSGDLAEMLKALRNEQPE